MRKLLHEALVLSLLAGSLLALGKGRRGPAGLTVMRPEAAAPQRALAAFQFDSPPVVAEEVLSKEQLLKTYKRPETRRKILVPVRSLKASGRAVAARQETQRRVPTQATRRKVVAVLEERPRTPKDESWGNVDVKVRRGRGREQSTFDPASSIMNKVSKGYVKPAPAPPKKQKRPHREEQTILQIAPIHTLRAVKGGPRPAKARKEAPVAPPAPPSSSRKTKPMPAKPSVLLEKEPTRRPLAAASTRRIVTSAKRTQRQVQAPTQAGRRAALKIKEETLDELSSTEVLAPVRTQRRLVEETKRRMTRRPGTKGHAQPTRRHVAVLEASSTTADSTRPEEPSSSETPVRARRRPKAPARKPAAKKPAATRRKATARRKAVEVSDSEGSTTTSTFERQFTRRTIKAKPARKPAGTKRRVVLSSASSSESPSEEEDSELSLSASYVPTSRKRQQPTRRQAGKKPKAPTKRPKPAATTRRAAKRPVSESSDAEETTEPRKARRRQPAAKREATMRRAVKGGTRRDIKPIAKKPARPAAKSVKKYETTEESTQASESTPTSDEPPTSTRRYRTGRRVVARPAKKAAATKRRL